MRVYQNEIEGSGLVSDIVGSVINKSVDLLPVELHIPGYQYCGPGTKLSERLRRGDPGVNKLDVACKQHDIAYSKNLDSKSRAKADEQLAERAWERFKSSDASLGEKAAAWAVTNIMKAKSKFGGGVRRKKKTVTKTVLKCLKNVAGKCGKGLYLRPYKKTGGGIKKKKRKTKQRRQK